MVDEKWHDYSQHDTLEQAQRRISWLEERQTILVRRVAKVDATLAERDKRIAELEAALATIHATSRRVVHQTEWYLDGVRQSPGVYVVMRVGDAPDAPVTPF